ncbi:hypothetical protein [Marinicella meishanensis]|uniref:hypothetical protein n=1 Tax=Marinicella meishanensis TaxID=2873263 RepID=UPI001CBC624D|nr:hypothetical protein [Marinicella sp. NBU2979]
METSVSEVVESFKDFLLVKYPDHYKKIENRLKDDELSAKTEALIFSYLRFHFNEVIVGEDISNGGVDFIVDANEIKFFCRSNFFKSFCHKLPNWHR